MSEQHEEQGGWRRALLWVGIFAIMVSLSAVFIHTASAIIRENSRANHLES